MKKKILISTFLVAIFIFFAKTNNNTQKNILVDTFMANVEALAGGEGAQPMDCYSNVKNENDGRPVETQTYCGDCQPIRCTHWWNQSRCMR